jgi:hypothetical protein
VHDEDICRGKLDPGIERDDSGIIPLLDLAKKNVGEHIRGNL